MRRPGRRLHGGGDRHPGAGAVDRPVGVDGPGIDDGVVGGAALGAAHASALSGTYTRVVTLRVETDDRALPTYRESRAVTDDATTQRRSYRGPATARFVSGNATATTARTVRSVDGNGTRRRTFVGGDPAPGTQVTAPVAADDRTESPDYRLSDGTVPGEAVPDPLAAPESVTVRAAVRRTGRVDRGVVRYDARLDGRRVSVAQRVFWIRGGDSLPSTRSNRRRIARRRAYPPRRPRRRPAVTRRSVHVDRITIHGIGIHTWTRSTTDRSSGR